MEKCNVFNEFMENVRNGKKAFVIKTDAGTCVSFISAQRGAAEYFFACKEYEECDFTGLNHRYEIAAIYAQEKFYVVDWFAFELYSYKRYDELLSDNIVDFNNFLADINTFLFDTAYPMYYKELKTTMHDSNRITTDNIMQMARRKVLKHDYPKNNIEKVTPDKAVQVLCRGVSFGTICCEVLDEQHQQWESR